MPERDGVPDRDAGAARKGAMNAPRPWLRGAIWWAVAFAAIVLGYADLARGGETLAPILLIAGYCIFIPIAILS
jgi:hypothetical protein